VLPFIINIPLLDYDASLDKKDRELRISITNLGIATAKNVAVSVDTNKSTVQFLNFRVEPALPKSGGNLSTRVGTGFFKIDSLPPTTSNNEKVKAPPPSAA